MMLLFIVIYAKIEIWDALVFQIFLDFERQFSNPVKCFYELSLEKKLP